MAFNRVSKLMARSERATPVGEGSADLLQTCALRFFFFLGVRQELPASDEAGFICFCSKLSLILFSCL